MEDALGVNARRSDPSPTVQAIVSGQLLLLTTTVVGAGSMSAGALSAHVSDAYVRIGEALSRLDRRPIRFWNFIPDPGEMMGPASIVT